MRRSRWLLTLALLAPAAGAPAEESALYARQGAVTIEVPEAARWRARVDALRTAREGLETQVADLRVLLERAMAELETVTKDRDAWKTKATVRRNE